jgi:predicted ArsR family transcriptional regulator
MEIVCHVAFSTITHTRRELLRAVLVAGGTLDAAAAQEILGVSRPTARCRMRELAATGIVSWCEGQGNAAESIQLTNKWESLLRNPEAAQEEIEVEAIPDAESRVLLWAMAAPFQLGQQV